MDNSKRPTVTVEANTATLKAALKAERDAIFYAMTRGQHYDIGLAKERMTAAMNTTINPSDSAPRPESRLPAEDNTEKLVQTIAEEVTAWQRGSRATLGRHIKRALMGEGMHGASSAAYLGNEPTTDTAGSIPASPDLTAALKGSV